MRQNVRRDRHNYSREYRRDNYSRGYDDYQEGYYNRQYQHSQSDPYNEGYYGESYYHNHENSNSAPNTYRNPLSYTAIRITQDKLRQLEGTWINKGQVSKKVIIVSTRDGIKVKDTTNNQWHRYQLSKDNTSLIDSKGNLYQVDATSLYWTAANGKRILQLEKKSKDTF